MKAGESVLLECEVENLKDMVLLWKTGSRYITRSRDLTSVELERPPPPPKDKVLFWKTGPGGGIFYPLWDYVVQIWIVV